jgi:hypothetical protein
MIDPVVLIGAPDSVAARLKVRPQTPRSREAVVSAYERNSSGALWVALRTGPLEQLAQVAAPKRRRQDLLLLRSPGPGGRELLGALFRHVIATDDDVRLLPLDELVEVLAVETRGDRFIGGAVAPSYKSIVLYRGTLAPLVVPAALFKARHIGPKPDFDDLEIIDFGQTVRLGKYEAAADAILYKLDADFRRRARQRQLGEDRSFGGALRRLRLQKGLSRGQFPGLSAKEIARLERGEVEQPHAATLAVLAKRLGVPAAAIGSY